MKRAMLALLAVAVLAAGIALLVWTRQTDPAAAAPAPARVAAPIKVATPPAPIRPAPQPSAVVSPVAPAAGSDAHQGVVVGVPNPDPHHGGLEATLGTTAPAPPGRQLPPATVAAISSVVKAAMAECGLAVTPDARGPSPRLEAAITIAIKAHVITVTTAVGTLHDVLGAVADPTKKCLETKALGLTAPAADQDDLDTFPINLSLRLR
jgi:hypothetical protein